MPVVLTLTLVNVSTAATHKTPIYVEWSVNATANGSIPLDLAEVAWGNTSVAEAALTNDTAYPEAAGNATSPQAPGMFNMSFTVTTPGTIYLRAHAIYQGQHFWSEEASVLVEIGKGAVTNIQYPAGAVTGAQARPPSPANPTLKRGDGFKIQNSDNLPHNAVCGSTCPAQFSVPNVAAGATSAGVYLTVPGTYRYSCSNHPNTMTNYGTITVSNELN